MKKILLAITSLALLSLSIKAQPGAALNFVATGGNYISVSTNTNIPIGNAPYTIEAWIQPLGSPANLGIIGWGNWGNTNQVNALRLDGVGGIYNYWWGHDLYASPSGFNLFDGNWHHVAATYDGTTRAIYVDGVLQNSDTPTPAAINSPNNLTVGATDVTGYFNGNIDEVRIWSRGLCQAEIQHNLNGELAASQTGLVAYYKFNQGTAAAANPTVTSLTDASGNSNTGTLNNFALTGTSSNWIANGAVTTGNILTAFTNTLSAVTTQTNITTCFGSTTGTASVTASGSGTFTYSWSPSGGTSSSATGLAAGNYTCTINNGCGTIAKTFTITQPTAISATTSSTNVSCFGGSNGTAGVNASGGTPGYTYSSAPSGGTGTTASGLTAGNYTCIITDAHSCTATKVVAVSGPSAAISATTSSTSVSCFGGSNGTAGVTVIGGTSPYTYLWAPSGGISATASGLTAGSYTCTITDIKSCTATKVVAVSQPTAAITATTSFTNASGGSNGAASVSVSGGTSPYTYAWAPSGGTGATATGLTAGNYTCTITDSHSCTTAKTLTVTQPSPAGAALNFDGVDDYVAVPDNAALDFGLNNFTIEADFQSSVSQADYTGVVAKSINGVSDGYGGYQLVLVNNNIAAEFADNQNNFLGVSNGLQGTSILTDGNWHHLAMVVNRATNNIKLLVDGTVEADVTNSLVSVINVTNPIEKMLIGVERTYNIHANANIDEVRVWNRAVCQAEIQNNMVGEVAKNANGLVAYYKFNQGFAGSNNTAITMLADSSSNVLNGTLNNFALTGATSNFITLGAVKTGSLVAVFTNTLSAVATQTNVVNCYGDANGVASVAASGYLPYIYTWSAGGSTSNTATGLTAGNYTCTLSNGCGTPIIQTFTITQPTQLVASSTSGTIACNGGTTTVSVTATGGTANYSGDGTYTVTANSYTYTVTDANQCTATTTLTITQPNAVNASVNVSGGTITANNATATYQWVDCNNSNAPISGATSQSYTVSSAGSYAVIVSKGSCSATSTCTPISTTGIAQNKMANSISVYPNPFSNELTIVSSAKTIALLFDMLGKQIKSFDLQNTTQTINVSDLAPGMYYLQVDAQKIKIINQ